MTNHGPSRCCGGTSGTNKPFAYNGTDVANLSEGGQTQSDQTLMFANTAGTAAVSGSVTVFNGMTFQTNRYTVAGGTISLAGAAAANNALTTDAGDPALANVANDLANNGTLRTTAHVSLDAGRDITGSGTFDIAPGKTLTSNGSFAMTATTLANGVLLAGALASRRRRSAPEPVTSCRG